jgi:hypothetical protein
VVQIRKDLSEAQETRLFENLNRLGMPSDFPSKLKWNCVKESIGIEESPDSGWFKAGQNIPN